MIGIIGAMEPEVSGIVALLTDTTTHMISGIKFVEGKYNNKDIVVAKCGIGKVFAALCAEAMILKFNPDFIVNTGVAGGIAKGLEIGDIAVARDVVQHDMDTTAFGDPKGYLSGLDIVNVPCKAELTEKMVTAAKNCGINCMSGTLATGDQFCAKGSEALAELSQIFNPLTTDMEGGSIGQVCYVNKTPFVVIRALSDHADDNAGEDYANNLQKACKSSIAVTSEFLKLY